MVALIKDCQQADDGAVTLLDDVYAVIWRTFDLERDVWLVVDEPEHLVAAATLACRPDPTQMRAAVNVHPGHRDRGIETELDRLIDARAREVMAGQPSDRRVVVHQSVGQYNDLASARLNAHGYTFVRRTWEMAMDLGEEPQPVRWPAGILVAALERGQERAVLDATNEAFRDHWGYVPVPYEQFMAVLDRPGADRSLSFIAWVEGEVAGCCLNLVRGDGAGYVAFLSVRRPWRRQGLGLALLGHSFNEFRRRELKQAALNVDSENLTGATRLYERAGMHVVRHRDTYERAFREGSPVPDASV